ncbi:DNA polymerase III subunit gamma and tau [Antiquaquibacter soli]|uniref:DNA polymerase III subunit gamma/tau n=1 Tax=Antiquaquibacter soli TaxID=3064523 RepID=A0ABT9BJ08_9MICO|nr:DNA polymerase III subunit gamma and tau [Protaetiibacter sp. WY-16]MDO7881009.1 DNA polymerase III subunit gamma and tau [Protaetiibacter sp. WY-16]
MVAALYRRYRPETFAELIGQSQVTDPLRTALRTDRVNHAYLFSGPRGCGKTTSARILARCLNCAEGPTDTPCGVCPSCVELSRDGGGSLDVVEIDAASHNGVDDARDLRERAVFAPARDRFKIFILDEAHMVTSQGFNALLKIVEEPPEHVKFIFATTEPEKVLGTIRSRTHHYPFRLVPPAQMLDYVQQLCESEGVSVDAGVLPLVVRAGGGSVRDTLSLLDQLIAGSESAADGAVTVEYERAVALLGYTHGALLDEVIDAIGARDAGGVFAGVDRVIQTGQDPRRFVEDLLERLRDLIIVAATSGNAQAVLRGVPQDQLDRMAAQAKAFGPAELSRAADVVNAALSEMTGATSPRLHLELMAARILVPASDDTERGALARVERLERRIGVDGPDAAAPAARPSAAPVPAVTRATEPAPAAAPAAPAAQTEPVAQTESDPEPAPAAPEAATPARDLSAPVTLQLIKDAWPEILEVIEKAKRTAWMVVVTAKPIEWRDGNVLVLSFPSQNDVAALRQQSAPGEGIGDHIKKAMVEVLGVEPLLLAKAVDAPPAAPPSTPAPAPAGAASWAVASIPASDEGPEDDGSDPGEPAWATQTPARPEPEAPAPAPQASAPASATAPPPPAPAARPAAARPAGSGPKYGESVVREILGASFIEEQPLKPRVVPQPQPSDEQ